MEDELNNTICRNCETAMEPTQLYCNQCGQKYVTGKITLASVLSTFFSELFHQMLSLFTSPFHNEEFDFSDETFWSKIADLSQEFSNDTKLRKMNGNRGSKHFLYINRTFFGLYNLLHDLGAKVKINNYKKYLKDS